MPVTGRETWDSRNVTVSPQTPDSVLKYFVVGSVNPEDITAWIIANAPLLYGVLWLQDADLTNLGGGCWFVDVQYGDVRRDGMGKPDGSGTPLDPQGEPTPPAEPQRPQPTDKLGPEYSGTIGSVTVHRTQAISTVASKAADGGNVPDNKRAIGLTDDGVQGVDVEEGTLVIRETRKIESITREYLKTLTAMVGKVCDADGFWGWERREAKYAGGDFQIHNDLTVTMTYEYHFRFSHLNVSVSPDITFEKVFGWDYIDVIYGATVDEDTKLRVPRHAYVYQIFEEASFKKLGVGN